MLLLECGLFSKKPRRRKSRNQYNEVIQEVLILTRMELQKNRVSLRTQFANDLPIAMGDKIQLQQVILNLVLNGIEAMSGVAEGQRELRVSSQKVIETPVIASKERMEGNAVTGPESASVLIAVQDSGPGLRAGTAARFRDLLYN